MIVHFFRVRIKWLRCIQAVGDFDDADFMGIVTKVKKMRKSH